MRQRLNPFHTIGLVVSILFLGSLTSGCATLTSLNRAELPTPNPSASQGSFTVSMETDFGGAKTYTGSIDDSMTISRALEISGAAKKYRVPEITILRRVEESGRGLRMDVDYDTKNKRIKPEQNYAIHPGDRIVVRAKKTSPLGSIGKHLGL